MSTLQCSLVGQKLMGRAYQWAVFDVRDRSHTSVRPVHPVVVLVLDARAEISDQDAHIAGYVLEKGRALVVAVNKWDSVSEDQRELVKRTLARKLRFLAYSRFHYISARKREGIAPLMASVKRAYAAAEVRLKGIADRWQAELADRLSDAAGPSLAA